MAISDKQQVFIEEYLTCWNATQAAIKAGYSERSARQIGSRLLTDDDIAEAIKTRMAEKAMSADEVLLRLADHARSSMDDFVDINGNINLTVARGRGKLHLLKSFSQTDKGQRIELHDAQAALVHIGRHHGLFTDSLNINFNPADLTDEQLARIAAGEDPTKVLRHQ